MRPPVPGHRRHPGAAARRGDRTGNPGLTRARRRAARRPGSAGRRRLGGPAARRRDRGRPGAGDSGGRGRGGHRPAGRWPSARAGDRRAAGCRGGRRPADERAAATVLPGPGRGLPTPCRAGSARSTSCSRTPTTPATPRWPSRCTGRAATARASCSAPARRAGRRGGRGAGDPAAAATAGAAGARLPARLRGGPAHREDARPDPGRPERAGRRAGPRGRARPAQHESFVNPAKSLALRLAEHTPLLWGLDDVATAIAGHAADMLATHAGIVCDVSSYAQACTRYGLHRAAVRASAGHDLFADPDDEQPGQLLRVMLLAIRGGPAEDGLRRAASEDLPGADLLSRPRTSRPTTRPAPLSWRCGSSSPRCTWGWRRARSGNGSPRTAEACGRAG